MKSPRKIKKKTFVVALVQYSIVEKAESNLKKVFSILEKLKKHKIDYVVLPEMWLGGPKGPKDRTEFAHLYKKACGALQECSAKYKIGFCFSQLEEAQNHFYNTAYLMEKSGKIVGSYRKIHLFSLGGERNIFSAGKKTRVFKSAMGKIGCVICYDIRFPELPRLLANRGAHILMVPAQWPASRSHHWLTLLKARAIENQFFVFATNRLGKKDGQSYQGDSVVISPWGKILLHLKKNQEWGKIKIDLGEVAKIRKKYPFFQERIEKFN